jgi:hypothetical protein
MGVLNREIARYILKKCGMRLKSHYLKNRASLQSATYEKYYRAIRGEEVADCYIKEIETLYQRLQSNIDLETLLNKE